MYGDSPPLVNAKPRVDESSVIISEKKVNSEVFASKSEKDRRLYRGSHGWGCWSSWIFFLQNFLLVYATYESADEFTTCALGIRTPGRTWPKGDIVLEYGQPLRIYCMLNEVLTDPTISGRNASDLVFFRHDTLIEVEHITVVNETTIMMYLEHPHPSQDMYYCKLKSDYSHSKQQYRTVCLNKVVIGFKPQEPLDFTCVSENWKRLICSWKPVHNNVATRFSLGFRLPGRSGRFIYPCPVPQMNKLIPPNTCIWDVSTNPMYRQVYEYYTFTLKVENAFGTETFDYRFHHFAHIIPSQPIDLSVISKTSSSVLVHWRVPNRMINFPPGLHHRVSYRRQCDCENCWQTIDVTDRKHKREIYFNITDLQYANAVYEIKVSSKSAKAIGEDRWSQFSNITFKTDATLPGLPLRTDVGSFEVVRISSSRDVYIYWQTIPAYLENGDNFTYQVVSVKENGHRLDLNPDNVTKTYAIFKGISLNNLTFEIVAANCKGPTDHKAVVRVPSQLEIPQKPVVFTKIGFDGGVYELSWDSPSNSDIVDYTIFWCENERDRPYQCSGYLDWVHIPQNTRIWNVTVPDSNKIHQFGIAANTAQASSGMVWFSGMTIFSNVVGKMNSVSATHVESDLIEVGWELEYAGRIGVIENFNIHYCPIVSALNLTCDGPEMVTTVRADRNIQHGVVRNLKPHTTYSITAALVTKNGEGLRSDAVYITTLKRALDPVSRHRITTDISPKPADTTDCMTQVSSSNLTISTCQEKIDLLLDEIRQLRADLSSYNEIRSNELRTR